MKKSFTKFLALGSIALLLLASCKKDETKVIANTSQAKSTFTASTTTPALSKDHLDDQAITFTIKSPDYGFKSAVSNSIQISTDDFATTANTKEVSLDLKATSKAFNVLDFNNILLGLNLPTGVATTVKARLKTQFSGSVVTPTYSTVVSLNVTPFALTSFIYLGGAYEGWTVPSPNVDSLLSATSNGIYTGIINFPAGKLEFKVLPTKKNFDGNYGSDGPGKITQGTGNPPNITAPAAGLTWVTVDMNNKTITFEPVKYYYSLIGVASPSGNWNDDTDLKYDNGNQVWQATVKLNAGEMKVRRNHDWGTSYGPPKVGADGSTLATSDTDNIPVAAAGTYYFTFALNAADNTKATYTLVKK
ncbi:SusE-like outer membrane protein [Mucilaginibacter oryzae]|uniref:SusE-like outer membrane protein n=1 Tax=Mucilaginibacter oryzae TaxID=468058 RepID=A0A316HIE5_9SPHI|nr:SusE domain-containing protein [Mucilaginibacter oryzae]PWK78045.1 SusE-like outer membrane protein [Mucilaginibacter oryzae]